jgi:2-dehydropantoate 2-reductase
MKILIFGAGTVGGYLSGILTAAGADVTAVTRGAQYEALATRDLVLESATTKRSVSTRVRICRQGEEQPPYDLIFVTLKSHHLAATARHIAGLRSSSGSIVFPQNGIPWWYFEKLDSPLRGTRLSSLDPEGELSKTFPIDSLVGGVAYRPTSSSPVISDLPTSPRTASLSASSITGSPRACARSQRSWKLLDGR